MTCLMSLSDYLFFYLVWSIGTGSLNFEHYARSAIIEKLRGGGEF